MRNTFTHHMTTMIHSSAAWIWQIWDALNTLDVYERRAYSIVNYLPEDLYLENQNKNDDVIQQFRYMIYSELLKLSHGDKHVDAYDFLDQLDKLSSKTPWQKLIIATVSDFVMSYFTYEHDVLFSVPNIPGRAYRSLIMQLENYFDKWYTYECMKQSTMKISDSHNNSLNQYSNFNFSNIYTVINTIIHRIGNNPLSWFVVTTFMSSLLFNHRLNYRISQRTSTLFTSVSLMMLPELITGIGEVGYEFSVNSYTQGDNVSLL